MEKEYNGNVLKELIRKYRNLCNELGKEEELKNVPDSKGGLTKKIGELTFEWIHEYV